MCQSSGWDNIIISAENIKVDDEAYYYWSLKINGTSYGNYTTNQAITIFTELFNFIEETGFKVHDLTSNLPLNGILDEIVSELNAQVDFLEDYVICWNSNPRCAGYAHAEDD